MITTLSHGITSVLGWIGRLRSTRFSPRQRIALVGVFAVLTVLAVRDFPFDSLAQLRPLPLLASFGLVFVTLLFSAASYRSQGLLLGYDLDWRDCWRTQVMASAANLLPIPGAVLVRTGALVDLGSSAGQAVSTTGIAGMTWLGVSGVVAGPAFAVSGQGILGGALTVASLALLVGSYVWTRQLVDRAPGLFWLRVLGPSIGLVVAFGARYLFLILGLGIDASFSQTLSLVVVGALASAVGFFPSGIGIRETLAAGAAALVDLPVSVGYVVAAIDDLSLLLVVGLLSLMLLGRRSEVEVAAIPSDHPSAL